VAGTNHKLSKIIFKKISNYHNFSREHIEGAKSRMSSAYKIMLVLIVEICNQHLDFKNGV